MSDAQKFVILITAATDVTEILLLSDISIMEYIEFKGVFRKPVRHLMKLFGENNSIIDISQGSK